MKNSHYYIVTMISGQWWFVENIIKEPVACLKRLAYIRKSIPGAVLCTPLLYKAIYSQN